MQTGARSTRRPIAQRLTVPLALAAVPALAATALAAGQHGAAGAVPADAGPAGVVITPLVKATIPGRVKARSGGISITTKGARALLATSITVAPDGTFGWHTHPGPVLVAVASGALTVYAPHGGGCSKRVVKAGEAFVDTGGDVHLARNEGTKQVQLYATFLAPKATKSFLTPAADPCPA